MATLEDLTSYEQVLAVLGIDDSELPESVFIARDLWAELDVDIASWLPSPDTVDSLLADSGDPGDETNAAAKVKRLELYAKYACAWLLLQSGDLLFSERIADGQNEQQRSKRVDYTGMLGNLRGNMDKHKTALLALYDATVTFSDNTPTWFSSARNAYDPVMNEAT